MSKLSNRQASTLGGLLAVMSGKEPFDELIDDLTSRKFIEKSEHGFALTELGIKEKNRLITIAGLMMESGYKKN